LEKGVGRSLKLLEIV